MTLDLYVMQTEHGLIKVGRSADPARRCWRSPGRINSARMWLAKWLEEFEDKQTDSYIMNRRRRLLRTLKGAEIGMGKLSDMTGGHKFLDAGIWGVIYGRAAVIGSEGAHYYEGTGRRKKILPIPRYTSNWETAWTLWDDCEIDPSIPSNWLENFGHARNPIACCVAALGVRWGIDFYRLKPTGGF